MDIGTQLMNNANKLKPKLPNQHIETIVYDGDDESEYSDFNEIITRDDDDFLNKTKIDIFKNSTPVRSLDHRYGCVELHQSNLSSEYNRQFLFKDPYIKEQLKGLKSLSNEFDKSILPATLIDYICCKRLEDNYNFYMDNIIKYVKHTIEQLKRISNGEYLTERAKEKWREVKKTSPDDSEINNHISKVLTNAASIPLHVERKVNKHITTWDDIVHSEVDIRSLCKILEKKIVIEIPKLINGSYKLFSKCYAENVIISCKKEDAGYKESKSNGPQVDVVFQLKRSDSGHVISNISSIMILHKSLSPIIPGNSLYNNKIFTKY